MTFEPRFLSVEDVVRLHALAIEDQRGDPASRDGTLLESAVMTPQQRFDGQFLHPDIPSMAAAYAYHVCKNHPFVDGNKRAGTAAMIAFLSDNGWNFDATADEAEPVILNLAAGTLSKVDLTEWVRTMTHEKPKLELRDFFRIVTRDQVRQAMGASMKSPFPTEFNTSLGESEQQITLLRGIREEAAQHHLAGRSDDLARCGVEMALLMHLYRIAEDMGYEW